MRVLAARCTLDWVCLPRESIACEDKSRSNLPTSLNVLSKELDGRKAPAQVNWADAVTDSVLLTSDSSMAAVAHTRDGPSVCQP